MKYKDSLMLDFLGKMDVIKKNGGSDGGWAFTFLTFDPDKDVLAADVTIAIRPVGNIREAINTAMTIAEYGGKKYNAQ